MVIPLHIIRKKQTFCFIKRTRNNFFLEKNATRVKIEKQVKEVNKIWKSMPFIKGINKLKQYLLNDNSLHNHKLNTKTRKVLTFNKYCFNLFIPFINGMDFQILFTSFTCFSILTLVAFFSIFIKLFTFIPSVLYILFSHQVTIFVWVNTTLPNDKETRVDKNLNWILLRYFWKIKYDVRLRIYLKMRLAVYINKQ